MSTPEQAQERRVHRLDTRGEICPYPLVMAQREMKKLKPGEALIVVSDYPLSAENIPRWATQQGHTVLRVEKVGDALWEIEIEKVGSA
ncbi:MAG: sulfurtransferase TusA family protein [Candidatus Methylomirabilales bacterium]